MKFKNLVLPLVVMILFISCGDSAGKQKLALQEKLEKVRKDSLEKVRKDSIDLVSRLERKKQAKIQDSITRVQQGIAIGDIKFGITKKEFDRKEKELVRKSPKTADRVGYPKIGEYVFNYVSGLFHNDSLYKIRIKGKPTNYRDYDRFIPDQYQALMNLLKPKYGEPSAEWRMPKWTDLNNGDILIVARWNIGSKSIEANVQCTGTSYFLNLDVYQPAVEYNIKKEREEKRNKGTEAGVDLI